VLEKGIEYSREGLESERTEGELFCGEDNQKGRPVTGK